MRITIDGEPIHLAMIRQACETYFRIALGQFREIAREHLRNIPLTGEAQLLWWDIEQRVEDAAKSILTPDLLPHASYGVGSPKVSSNAHVCYELWKVLGGGTDDLPLNYSGVALPRVTFTRTGE